MAAATFAPAVSTRPSLVARKNFAGVQVARTSRPQTVCRAAKPVVAKAQKKQEVALPAGVIAGVAAMMSNPLVAEAAVTPSLRNLLGSVAAGGAVFAGIIFAVSTVSSFDPVARGRK